MIRRIGSGSAFEETAGYCRAVVANNLVFVAGTCAQGDEIPTDTKSQCASALAVIDKALQEAGTDSAHVVRVVYYLTDIRDFDECLPVIKATFGSNPPAGTIVEAKLIDPADRIEIEVTAVLPD